jgi:hypothetical protein
MTHTPAQMYSVKNAAKPKSTSLVTAAAKAMMGVASNKSALTRSQWLESGFIARLRRRQTTTSEQQTANSKQQRENA